MRDGGGRPGLSVRSVVALGLAFCGLLVVFSGLSRLAGGLPGSPWTAFGAGAVVAAGALRLLTGGRDSG